MFVFYIENAFVCRFHLDTSEIEFTQAINQFDLDKFTLILIDSPGFGRSRPSGKWTKQWHETDAKIIHQLMVNLNIDSYSIVGINDGSRIAIYMASLFPERINGLVLCNCNAYFSNNDKSKHYKVKDINDWSFGMKEKFMSIYECQLDQIQLIWSNYVNSVVNTFIPKHIMSLIQCQTLLLYGEKDTMSPRENGMFIQKNIRSSNLKVIKGLTQNFHKENPKQFVNEIEKFLIN